jgi:predicted nucleic acid-binding Zn ribbon protein
MRYKIFSEIEKGVPSGAKVFYAATPDPRLYEVKMWDLINDVRLNNIYRDSGANSVAEFLQIVVREIPRNYGAKSHLMLLTALETFLGQVPEEVPQTRQIGHRQFSSIEKEYPKGTQRFYADQIDTRLNNLQMEEVVDDVRINNVYRDSGAKSVGEFIKLVADQVPQNYGSRSHRLILELLERLPVRSQGEQANNSGETMVDSTTSKWRNWWKAIEAAGMLDFPIGKVAALNGIDWPSNRMKDPISSYRSERPGDLLGKERLGKKRVQAIMACVRALAENGASSGDTLPMTCAEAATAAHIEEDHAKILRLRFLQGELRTLDSCGEVLNKTRERVRQIEKLCIERIRIAGFRDNLRAWLKINSNKIWEMLSDDNGMTVSGGRSENSINNRLPGEYQLALLIADMNASEILDEVGDRIDDWWAKR